MKANVTVTIRSCSELNPLVKIMLNSAMNKIRNKNITPLIVETYRPKERQYYLYGKGRAYSTCIGAGMPRSMANKYARPGDTKVTWTLNSIHTTRCAVDLIPQRKGKAIWDSNDEETKKIIKIMQSVGFEAGANWSSSPDSPHFQVAGISSNSKCFKRSNTNRCVTKMIQSQLAKTGYYNHEIDGLWGKATDTAIKKWKKSFGWKANTSIGVIALRKLLLY